jgi:hypothetical protein
MLIHTLCSSPQHVQSVLSLLYLHQLLPGNGFQCRSFLGFHVYVLMGWQLFHNSFIAPTDYMFTSLWAGNCFTTHSLHQLTTCLRPYGPATVSQLIHCTNWLTRRLAAISHQPPTLLTAVWRVSRNHSSALLHSLGTNRTENMSPNSSSIVAAHSYCTDHI